MSERAKERRLARMRFPARHVCENTLFEVSGREGDICPFCGGRLTRSDDDREIRTDGGTSSSRTDRCEECGEKPPLPELSRCLDCVNDGLPDGVELPEVTRKIAERKLQSDTGRSRGEDR